MGRSGTPPEPELGVLQVTGSRRAAYALYGPDDGMPVVFHYGTPGTRLLGPAMVAAARRHGVRLLAFDRPGYGPSTRRPDRRVVDVVDDVARLADALGWERFATWGGSGGAPHALACAARLPDRVRRCASVVGPAPFDGEGLDWFAGMSAGNVAEFTAARQGVDHCRPVVERLAREAVLAVEAGDPQVPADYDLPDADVAALQARLSEPGNVERVRAAYADGIDGWVDDMVAMTRTWGFDLSRIRVPVSVWYGPDDVLSPRAHAEWLLAHMPAERRELAAGHLLGGAELDRIYSWLCDDGGA